MSSSPSLTWRSFLLGALFAAFFSWLTVVALHRQGLCITSTQVAVLPFMLLFVMVLLLNPLCRLIRIVRPFTIAEVLVVFVMGAVSSGVSTFGLSDQLVPLAGSLFYKDWNTEQAQWERYIAPYLNEAYFISEPGIQKAAQEYKTAADRRDTTRQIYDLATGVATKTSALQTLEAKPGADEVALKAGRDALAQAQTEWDKFAAKNAVEPLATVLATYRERLRADEESADAQKRAVLALEEKAFAKVELFRRGLPKGMQSYPGIFPLPGDDFASYFGRLDRLLKGKSALGHVEAVLKEVKDKSDAELISPPSKGGETEGVAGGAAQLQQALDKLVPLADAQALSAAKTEMDRELDRVTRALAETDAALSHLNAQKRYAARSEEWKFDDGIAAASAKKKTLAAERKRLEQRLKSNAQQRDIAEKIVATTADLRALAEQLRAGHALTAGALRARLETAAAQFPGFDASYTRYFFGDTPWGLWCKPLLHWGLLLVLTYIVLMTFNVLIFRQWAHNEKLIYPLVELPEILVGHKDAQPGSVPEVFRSGLFWLGFCVAALVLGWNLLARSQVVAGLQPLDLSNLWGPYIEGTALKGLLPSAQCEIFFTMIGLSFLIPARVSFSLWFFRIFYMVELLLLVWLGYGENERSFPKDWYYALNLMTGQGGGAILVFAIVVLYKCRKYLFCAFAPASVGDLPLDEQKELRVSSFLFWGCSLGLILALWLSLGANLFYTVFFYFGIMIMTIGLVRAVAEGGVLGFQCWVSPLHFIRNIFGIKHAWSAAPLFTPLMVYYSILFLDIKTFIAPAFANSLKVRDDLRLERGRFHLAIVTAIGLAALVAIGLSLMMCYSPGQGGNSMNSWFYVGFPRGMVSQLKDLTVNPPASDTPSTLWILAGAGLMALLLYLRQNIFWMPHPIGLVMLVNPIMAVYWFSIFLGWLAKSLVTKYGNRDTYVKMRALFIGFIVGELFIICVALYVSYVIETPMAIDLNRGERSW